MKHQYWPIGSLSSRRQPGVTILTILSRTTRASMLQQVVNAALTARLLLICHNLHLPQASNPAPAQLLLLSARLSKCSSTTYKPSSIFFSSSCRNRSATATAAGTELLLAANDWDFGPRALPEMRNWLMEADDAPSGSDDDIQTTVQQQQQQRRQVCDEPNLSRTIHSWTIQSWLRCIRATRVQ